MQKLFVCISNLSSFIEVFLQNMIYKILLENSRENDIIPNYNYLNYVLETGIIIKKMKNIF